MKACKTDNGEEKLPYTSCNLRTEPNLSDMREFLTSPLPKSVNILQCVVRINVLEQNPSFSLFIENHNIFLLTSQRNPDSFASDYRIFMDQNNLMPIGALRSNMTGSEYQILDFGLNPNNVLKEDFHEDSNLRTNSEGSKFRVQDTAKGSIRCELGWINYEPHWIGLNRPPTKLHVALPGIDENNRTINWKDSTNNTNYIGSYCSSVASRLKQLQLIQQDEIKTNITKQQECDIVLQLINKPPMWNGQLGAYTLNFYGRATLASVRNFQLIDPNRNGDDRSKILLQFGRIAVDRFTMDLRWPFSPLQAFAIILSRFDYNCFCDTLDS